MIDIKILRRLQNGKNLDNETNPSFINPAVLLLISIIDLKNN